MPQLKAHGIGMFDIDPSWRPSRTLRSMTRSQNARFPLFESNGPKVGVRIENLHGGSPVQNSVMQRWTSTSEKALTYLEQFRRLQILHPLDVCLEQQSGREFILAHLELGHGSLGVTSTMGFIRGFFLDMVPYHKMFYGWTEPSMGQRWRIVVGRNYCPRSVRVAVLSSVFPTLSYSCGSERQSRGCEDH